MQQATGHPRKADVASCERLLSDALPDSRGRPSEVIAVVSP